MRDTLPNRVRVGAFEVDLRAGELWEGQNRVRIQQQPFEVLLILIEARGDVVTREEIRKKLWPNDTIVEFDHSINVAIKKLRQAFGDSADEPKYVETLARRGYRLLVPVEQVQAAPSDNSPRMAVATGDQQVAGPNLIGQKVSHYRVLDVLGGGGMGLVYRAEDLKLGRQVALKFLPEEMAWDPIALQRFEREARTASSLDHPNICTIYEVEEHADQPFIVMQLLEGETLRDRLVAISGKKPRLRVDEILDIAEDICNGLQAAHEKGIIHRDIKPANIFLTSAGQVKLLDFGLAKAVSRAQEEDEKDGIHLAADAGAAAAAQPSRSVQLDSTLTRLGVAVGTAGYMSPEQIRGEKLDARTDLFSFGLVLYEMTTGHRAFTGQTEADLHDAITQQGAKPVGELAPDTPPRLITVIDKCLEKDRSKRYQSAAEISADLDAVSIDVLPLTTNPLLNHRKRWMITAVVIVCAFAGILYWHSRDSFRLSDQDTIVITDFVNQTSDPVFTDTFGPALEVAFGQTPFLSPLEPEKISQTLKLLRAPDERLTPALAQQVCLRTHSAAYVTGALSDAGNQYRIDLNVINCKTGNTIASASETVRRRNELVRAVGNAAIELRRTLGEPKASLEKYNKPLDQATTTSPEALHAFAAGRERSSNPESVGNYQRALELDPEFALAYSWLWVSYTTFFRSELAQEAILQAYQLRGQRLSRRDASAVEVLYTATVLGDYEQAASLGEVAVSEFPQWGRGRHVLALALAHSGHYERAAEAARETIRLKGKEATPYMLVADSYLRIDRFDDAKLILNEAEADHVDGWVLHRSRYRLAFLQNNGQAMQEQVTWADQRPNVADFLLSEQAEADAYYGRLRQAYQTTHAAVRVAEKAGTPQRSAEYVSAAALFAARAGDVTQARSLATKALSLQPDTMVPQVLAARALAEVGDAAGARKIANELNARFPQHVALQTCDLPAIRTLAELAEAKSSSAWQIPETPIRCDERFLHYFGMDDAYIRGEIYLKAARAPEAAAEFRKLIERRGLVANSIDGPLAHLQLARSQMMMGDVAAARKSYQEFLAIWKGADADLPTYKQAKAEFAKLR